MIESFIDGRIRLRTPLFAEHDLAEAFAEMLRSVNGVTHVELNARTCGMLLEYDPKRIPMSLLMKAAPLLERVNRLAGLPHDERRQEMENLLQSLRAVLSAG